MTHASHPAISKRLKRSHGHLRKIIEMIDEGRPCAEIAQQLHAVEKAVQQAKKTLIHDHIDHCLSDVTEHEDPQEMLAEFRDISKYL